jgi:flagellar motor switch protein FliG
MSEQKEVLSLKRKAAILVVLLGESASAELLKQLSEEEVRAISLEVARIKHIYPEHAEQVLEEYYAMITARAQVVTGGVEYAKRILQKAFGSESSRKMVETLVKSVGGDAASFEGLQKTDPKQLAKFIINEHPQTIALILSRLAPSQAATLLSSVPSTLRSDVAWRMAALDQISPEVIARISTIVGQKLKDLGGYSQESYGGVRAVAEICNRMDPEASNEVLADIEQQDPNLATTIRNLMFVFEDVIKIDDNSMTEILSRIDRKILTLALKGTNEELKAHFGKFMSKRAQDMLREDMEALGPVRIREVEGAQQQIIAVIRQLEQQGILTLHGSSEQYVE